MLYKILCNFSQTFFTADNMKFPFYLIFEIFNILFVKIRILVIFRLFNDFQKFFINFWIFQFKFTATIFIIKRNSCPILYRTLKVIYRNIITKSSLCNIIARKQRRSCKSQTTCLRQQCTHILSKNTIVCSVSFIRNQKNIMIYMNRSRI